MAETIKAENGVPILILEEVVIGSQLRIAAFFEQLIDQDPDVFEPISFAGMEMKADIKMRPAKEVDPDATFVCTPRIDLGWVDFTLDGEVTGELLPKTYESSFKVWPTGHPEQGDTLWVIVIPMTYKATR
jgi:hypothetical protein